VEENIKFSWKIGIIGLGGLDILGFRVGYIRV
jgi:hypothetical protein